MTESAIQYVELLVQLRSLIDDGRGEGNEAEALRDRMDPLWRRMKYEEQRAVALGIIG